MAESATLGGAVALSTSGYRATSGWPLRPSNNKHRQHSRKMFSVNSCQFTSGPCHFSDATLFRPLGRNVCWRILHTTEGSEQWSVGEMTWTRSELTAVPHMAAINLDFRESKPKFLYPNSFYTIAEITRTTSLCCGCTRESENPTQSLRFIISENIPVSSVTAKWMNKDHLHVSRKKLLFWQMCLKLLLYNLVDDQRLGKHALLIQPWVKSMCGVLNACWLCYTYRGQWHDTGFLHLLRHLFK